MQASHIIHKSETKRKTDKLGKQTVHKDSEEAILDKDNTKLELLHTIALCPYKGDIISRAIFSSTSSLLQN